MANFPFGSGSLLGGNPYLNKQPRLDIYPSTNKSGKTEFWWRIYMSSDIVAASSEGYSSRDLCIDNLKKIANHIKELERTGKLV
jgi:uncharacterized protein YegP (UPF0339 family)